jgi:hypothetical protein
MGYNSQSGQVILSTQDNPGVASNRLATEGISVRLRSGALTGNRDLLTPDAEIGGGRDTSDAYLGAVSFSGDYEMYVRFRAIAMFLRAALGEVETESVGGAFRHTVTPSDGQVPFLSVYEEISNGLERFLYTDVVVNTFHLEAEANGYLMATAGMIGRLVTAGVPDIDGDALTDNTSLVVGTNITITYNGVTVPAKSFSLDVTNNFEDDDFRLGSFFLGDLTAKRREVTASMTLRHNDNSAMRQALFGTSTATQIGGLTTKQALVINIAAYEDVPGATAGTKFSLTITLPKVIFAPFAFEPSGDDALENDVDMTAVRPDLAQPVMRAVVVNDSETVA